LAQRRLFEIPLEAAIARQRRSGKPVALLYGDLDGFKAVNDRHGHHVGNGLLALVAQRLLAQVRGDDTVVRLGVDEFAILLEGSGIQEAHDLAMYQVKAHTTGDRTVITELQPAQEHRVPEPRPAAALKDTY
jgi:diguanylate cyclase (GGDEF)-like protein